MVTNSPKKRTETQADKPTSLNELDLRVGGWFEFAISYGERRGILRAKGAGSNGGSLQLLSFDHASRSSSDA